MPIEVKYRRCPCPICGGCLCRSGSQYKYTTNVHCENLFVFYECNCKTIELGKLVRKLLFSYNELTYNQRYNIRKYIVKAYINREF